jgi:hypothetical protein
VATALQPYASQLRTLAAARSLAERLIASILAPLIRAAFPNVSTLIPLTKSKGARTHIRSCYGSSDGKRGVAEWPELPRPSSTLPQRPCRQPPKMSAVKGTPAVSSPGRDFSG